MANNAVYANIGTYGVNDQPQVGPLMQAQSGVLMLFTLADLTGTAIDLSGLTLSGTITNNLTSETAALAGALTIVTPAAGVFSWTTDEDDVGTAGEFTLIFQAGEDIISLPAHLSILETPGASVTFGAALMGVTAAERAWLTAALAALPDAGDLANVPDPAGATDGYVWTADGADSADWEALPDAASDVDDLTTTTGNSTEMVRVAAAGGLEYRTPAQVLSDIGAPDPTHVFAEAGRVWKADGAGGAAWSAIDIAEVGGEDGVLGDMLRADGAGYFEYRTPEQVLGDIGAQAALPEEEAEWLTEAVNSLPDASALQSMPNPADAPAGVASIWTTYSYGVAGWATQLQFITSLVTDFDTDPGNTRLLLWDVDTDALVRVSVGADDSGGTGYKVLRIPNG